MYYIQACKFIHNLVNKTLNEVGTYLNFAEQKQINSNRPSFHFQIWPQSDFPLIQVGHMVLDKNPSNYYAEIEQLAFNPNNLIPGIEPTPDKMLQVGGLTLFTKLLSSCTYLHDSTFVIVFSAN